MQYLIKHTTHTTGETFTDVTKIRDNETFTVVEAESKEKARDKLKEDKEHIDISNICRYSNWF
ncbi:DUF1381 domain-containing protein [Staphylococcus shinii]|uniref:DUF1381 domain-containing protein n=1 Tax=Staphylococcus shinii TaxID=2912228 RepID=UPI003F57EFD4